MSKFNPVLVGRPRELNVDSAWVPSLMWRRNNGVSVSHSRQADTSSRPEGFDWVLELVFPWLFAQQFVEGLQGDQGKTSNIGAYFADHVLVAVPVSVVLGHVLLLHHVCGECKGFEPVRI